MNIEKESPQPMEVDETSGPPEVQDDSEKTLGVRETPHSTP